MKNIRYNCKSIFLVCKYYTKTKYNKLFLELDSIQANFID